MRAMSFFKTFDAEEIQQAKQSQIKPAVLFMFQLVFVEPRCAFRTARIIHVDRAQ
jgi:hypothetical protein